MKLTSKEATGAIRRKCAVERRLATSLWGEVGLMDKRRVFRFLLCLIVIVMIMLYIAPKAYWTFMRLKVRWPPGWYPCGQLICSIVRANRQINSALLYLHYTTRECFVKQQSTPRFCGGKEIPHTVHYVVLRFYTL